ncbi:MAG: hypothetical protein D6763_05855, partial [Alphaproteobacteria bacterium]
MKSQRLVIAGIIALVFAVLGLYLVMGGERGAYQNASNQPSWNSFYIPGTNPEHDGDETAVSVSTEEQEATAGSGLTLRADQTDSVTFSNVTLEDAVRGAIVGDYYGLAALRSYFDAALGDVHAVERLAEKIMDALEGSNIRNDYQAMADATRRLTDAVAEALSSGYILPYELAVEEGLPRHARGWDFGAQSRAAPRGFVKISASSAEVKGKSVQVFELDAAQPLFGDGLAGVEGFAAPLADGLYRVYLLSGRRADGRNPTYPFGDGVRTNGRSIRIVDAAQTFAGAEIRFTTEEVVTFAPPSALESGAFTPRQINYGPDGDEAGLVLATRALVLEGTFLLEFDIPEGAETYIVGIVIEQTDLGDFEEDLEQQIAALLAGTEPASGTGDGVPSAEDDRSSFTVAFLPPDTSPQAGRKVPGFRGGPGGGFRSFNNSSGGGGFGGSSGGGTPGGDSGSTTSGGGGSSTSGGGIGGGPSGGSSSGGGSSGGSSSGGSSTSSGGNSSTGGDSSSGGDLNSQDDDIGGGSSTSGGDGSSTSGGGSSTSGGDGSSSSGGGSSTSGGDGSSTSGGDGSSSSG